MPLLLIVRTYQLHAFCDASTAAYAAVVYLVEEDEGCTYSHLVVSKTRVSPLKLITVPRLELLSTLCLARLMSNVTESLSERLNLEKPGCFTDTQVTLFWIRVIGKDWKPFVQNRVDEIQRLTPVECWNYCPGRENPADLLLRGLTPTELATNQLWKCGPNWLKTPETLSMTPSLEEIPEPCLTELKASSKVGLFKDRQPSMEMWWMVAKCQHLILLQTPDTPQQAARPDNTHHAKCPPEGTA